jgi:hypothetical protein
MRAPLRPGSAPVPLPVRRVPEPAEGRAAAEAGAPRTPGRPLGQLRGAAAPGVSSAANSASSAFHTSGPLAARRSPRRPQRAVSNRHRRTCAGNRAG